MALIAKNKAKVLLDDVLKFDKQELEFLYDDTLVFQVYVLGCNCTSHTFAVHSNYIEFRSCNICYK